MAVRKTSEPVLMKSSGDFSVEVPPWVSSNTNPSVLLSPPSASHQDKTKSRTPTLPVRVPDITKRVRSESVPRSFGVPDLPLEKVEVVKVLSTAGSVIRREKEKVEALSNS